MKNVIQLGSGTYEVRRIGEIRQVRFDGEWQSVTDFVDWLQEKQRWDELAELVVFGVAKMKEMQ